MQFSDAGGLSEVSNIRGVRSNYLSVIIAGETYHSGEEPITTVGRRGKLTRGVGLLFELRGIDDPRKLRAIRLGTNLAGKLVAYAALH